MKKEWNGLICKAGGLTVLEYEWKKRRLCPTVLVRADSAGQGRRGLACTGANDDWMNRRHGPRVLAPTSPLYKSLADLVAMLLSTEARGHLHRKCVIRCSNYGG